MVGSINNGFQQQPPIANTFKPGEQQNGAQKVTQEETLAKKIGGLNSNKTVNLTPSSNTEQVNSKVALSDNIAQSNPNNLGSSANRGSVLDISV